MPRTTTRRAPALLAAALLAACGRDTTKPDTPTAPVAASQVNTAAVSSASSTARIPALAAVFAGNAEAVAAEPTLAPPGTPVDPWFDARLYAITNLAMHDALNAIAPRYARYADTGPVEHDANAAAAVLTAAHDAIAGGAPGAAAAVDAWYAGAIGALSGAAGFAQGVAVGHRTAAAILSLRAHDGSAAGGVAPYVPGSQPGDYRFTPPFNTPAFNFFGTGGFADGDVWAQTVPPFALASASQFRVAPPYGAASNADAVHTARYTADYNEIKTIGCTGCTARSAEQSEIAIFWRESSPTGWNRIARIVAERRSLDATDAARLFAVTGMGEFDAYIAALDSKYHYNFWRPVSAVALAGTDGNPLTAPVAGWQEFAPPTPPIPDYPSAHSVAGGTAAAVIEALVPTPTPFTTLSGSLPGVTRHFASVAQAAKENADSRVYIGYHFRYATEVGLAQGRSIGTYLAGHTLLPLGAAGPH
ncbi:hypothetical protein tb265_44090 [Gemmatimonadetes bacterium T265]|nr:hypothetical protein tb265_44090 [Gemmatimonadetes bacterium T265]